MFKARLHAKRVLPELLGLALLIGLTAPAFALPLTFENIQNAESQGLITADEAALNRIFYVFEPDQVDSRFFVENDRPLKSATGLIWDTLNSETLSQSVKDLLQGFIDPPDSDESRVLYISPSGIFRLTYATTGGNAVPLADNDGSGTPDFVEWCADYMDYAWLIEIDTLGFIPPVIIPNTDYAIYFESMGAYGYTTPLGSGRTRITLHNSFLGFPANDDPDGNQKGAAKVTCAHEFKHASQYTTDGWLAGTQWIELDAVWTEETVHPQTNDYKWYVNSAGSPLRNPEQSLDYVTQGGYEDAIWQLYLTGTHGVQFMVDLWDYRDTHPVNMVVCFNTILQNYGSNLSDAWGEWTRWNYLTGARTEASYGYDDAGIFSTCTTMANQSSLPANPLNLPVNHLASRYVRYYNLSGYEGWPKIVIDGVSGVDFRPQVIVSKTDDSFAFYDMELDAENDGELIVNQPFESVYAVGVSLPNADTSGDTRLISVFVTTGINTSVDEGIPGYGAMRLHENFPNPFNPETTLRYELAQASNVTLTVHDASGRRVRRLLDGAARDAGAHELTFDGKDEAGLALPSGVYFAQLDLGEREQQLIKMTLLK